MPDSKQKQARLALMALLGGGLAIGCSPILVRLAEVGPFSTAFWRLGLALVPLLLFRVRQPATGRSTPRSRRDVLLVSLPGLLLAAELAAWHVSLHLTSVANATLLVNMAPIFVSLYFWLFLRQAPGLSFSAALVIAVLGVVILKGGPQALGDGDLGGDGIAIFAAMLYAAYIVALGKMRERFSTASIMIWSSSAGALAILPFALWAEPVLIPFTVTGWLVILTWPTA